MATGFDSVPVFPSQLDRVPTLAGAVGDTAQTGSPQDLLMSSGGAQVQYSDQLSFAVVVDESIRI